MATNAIYARIRRYIGTESLGQDLMMECTYVHDWETATDNGDMNELLICMCIV